MAVSRRSWYPLGFLGPGRRRADILSTITSTATNTQTAATAVITTSSRVMGPAAAMADTSRLVIEGRCLPRGNDH
jgi:hypothetical protein